tara:strand:+ start:2792 stop:2899 length:108 start_codon:yes stop_codon:yes gene_type:complete
MKVKNQRNIFIPYLNEVNGSMENIDAVKKYSINKK